MTGDNCKVITSWGWGWGGGNQVPDSHLQQLATGPPLPAPHAGHARLIRPVRRKGYISESEYLLSQYRFTRKFVLRCTVSDIINNNNLTRLQRLKIHETHNRLFSQH